jgi:hypothetical protein
MEDKTMLSDSEKWAEIKLLYCCSGMLSRELSEIYGVKEFTIRKRAERGEWPTPRNLRKKVEQGEEYVPPAPADEPKDVIKFVRKGEISNNDLNAEILRRWTKRADDAREEQHEMLSTLLKNFNPDEVSIENIRDLKLVMDMNRENLGMTGEGTGGSAGAKPLVNLQILGGASPVVKTVDI